MACRICMEMERSLRTAQEPDSGEQLRGLTPAGIRNRAHQREERLSKMEADLSKHRKTCVERQQAAAEAVAYAVE